jgi:hypothetical protein
MPKNTAFILSSLAILVVLALASSNFKTYVNRLNVLGAETESPIQVKNIEYWDNLLKKNPTYFEGWIQLSKLEKANGNPLRSFECLNKARSINPNSPLFSLP